MNKKTVNDMPENRHTTDSELLLQIVGYNSNAFEQLYNRYSATIYSLIKEVVTNPKQAEKILLNVFSIFLKRIDHYSTTSNNVFTGLTLLARNISIDTVKRMKFVEDIPIYSDEYEIEFMLPNLSEQISLINLEDRNKLSEKIKSYKNQLSEIQNLILSLIYFEGLNEDEIAKRLSVPPATVRQRIIAIIDTLYLQYTGQNENLKGNKEILNLIKLESLGCLTIQEKILFDQLRKNDPDFMWKEYGEYQNLTALLSIAIPETKPSPELNSELNGLFTKILSGGEVDYPIAAAEIPIIEKEIQQIPEPPSEKVETPKVTEEIKAPEPIEPVAEKSTGFQLKFRERDPKELNILKSLDAVDLKPKSTPSPQPVVAKTDPDIILKNYQKAPVKKPAVFVDSKIAVPETKRVINTNVQRDNTIQNKIAPAEIKQPDVKIENNDPSIIIEEPKQVKVQENLAAKSRLIPNSSINLKEIFKKDNKPQVNKDNTPETIKLEKIVEENPVKPSGEKPEIIVKSNEATKEFRKNVFVDKNETVKSHNYVAANQGKVEIVNKQSEVIKEIPKAEPIVQKEEKTPAINTDDSGIKTNLSPEEIKRESLTSNQNAAQPVAKQTEPIVEKSEIKFKPITPPKEIKKTFSDAIKQETLNSQKNISPTSERPNEPVKESINTSNAATDPKEVNQKKSTERVVSTEGKAKAEPKSQTARAEETKPAQEAESFVRIKPTIDRSNLKIRETVFEENNKKPKPAKSEAHSPQSEPVTERINADNKSALNESINIDEIVSKIEEGKNEPVVASDADNYEKEIIKLRKKLRRNIFVSAALITLIIAASVILYLNFKENPFKVVENNTKSEKVNLAGQTNVAALNELQTEDKNEDIVNVTEVPIVTEKIADKKEVIPPLPKISTKEESTLFASNVTENLITEKEELPKQTVAAKTETIIPPKENKTIEEEPSYFVAVEQMPELIGGIKELQNKIVYPEIAKRVGVEGKVIVQAIVDENGKVVSVNTVKGIGSGCDEVAMDAVRNSKFVPGKQRGRNVKVQVTIPIVFKK